MVMFAPYCIMKKMRPPPKKSSCRAIENLQDMCCATLLHMFPEDIHNSPTHYKVPTIDQCLEATGKFLSLIATL